MNWKFYYTISDYYLLLDSEKIFYKHYGNILTTAVEPSKKQLLLYLLEKQETILTIEKKINLYISIFYKDLQHNKIKTNTEY